jgi:tetratricopeptide (TPR) repeat protein
MKGNMGRRKNTAKRLSPLAASPVPGPLRAALPGERLRPWLLGGITALYVARPLFPSESVAADGDGLTVVMLWIALAVFWLLGAIGRPKFSLRFGWTDAAVLLLMVWHTAAALWATQHGTPRPAVNMLWEWIGLGLCFLLTRQLLNSAREARAMLAVMVALAVAVAGYGLYQRVWEMPQTRLQYEADPDRALRDAGLWLPPGSPERTLFVARLNSTEPLATFALTNSLAAFLAPWLVMLAGIMWHSRPRLNKSHGTTAGGGYATETIATAGGGCATETSRRQRFGMLLCLLPIVVCLLLTKSRSGYIAAGVGLLLVWLLCREHVVRRRWKMPVMPLAAATLLLTVAVVSALPRELVGRAATSFGYRLQYWQSSLRMIADHPLIGCGPGNFQNAYVHYKLPEASEEVADPHNFLLEIGVTAGTPAALAFLAVLGCFAWATKRQSLAMLHSTFVGSGATAGLPSSAEGTVGQANRGTQKSNCAEQSVAHPASDGWRHVLAGGAFGFLLSAPVGMLSAAPPGRAAVLLGLPLAAATVAIMWPWIKDGRLPRLLPAVGVVVILIDLLASGGIGFPGVAETFWLLLAVGLLGEQPRALHPAGAWAGLLAALALVVACYATAYSPVLGCQGQLRKAEREPARAVEHLEAAAATDPLAVEPWRQLAGMALESWWRQPNEDAFHRFEQAVAKTLELAPNSAPVRSAAGDWYLRASLKRNPGGENVASDAIKKGVAAYRQAVELYPNSPLHRAKLAEACLAAGDLAAFRVEATAALRLDEATPHADKKLPAATRERLSHGLSNRPQKSMAE